MASFGNSYQSQTNPIAKIGFPDGQPTLSLFKFHFIVLSYSYNLLFHLTQVFMAPFSP